MADPFIVTAALPPEVFAWADSLRRAHFPPKRNKLRAHVTLFHSFAPSLFEELKTVLPRIAAIEPPCAAELTGLMDLGGGTALAVRSPAMLEIRERIADHFHGVLTAQDLHEPRLHITIQNKVASKEAKALQRELGPRLELCNFHFPAMELYIYRRGPWTFVKRWAFRG